jgi:integrase
MDTKAQGWRRNSACVRVAISVIARFQSRGTDATPPKQIKYEAGFLTVEQAEKLLKAIKGHRYEGVIVIALMLGLRSGEVAALRWSNIDFIDRLLYVRGSLQRLPKQGVVLSPVKTKQSRREIPIPQMCIDALIERQKIQAQEKIAAGEKWVQDTDFVFSSRYGRRIEVGTPWKVLDAALDDAELPHIRFHDLRHTTASLLLKRGVHPKVVSAILGHASFQITMDLYSHHMPTRVDRGHRFDERHLHQGERRRGGCSGGCTR